MYTLALLKLQSLLIKNLLSFNEKCMSLSLGVFALGFHIELGYSINILFRFSESFLIEAKLYNVPTISIYKCEKFVTSSRLNN